MSVAVRRDQSMRVAEFIAFAGPKPDEERWELIGGEPVLMAPPGERHQLIVLNLARALAAPKGCRALPGLGILNDAVDDYAPIPDVVVRCGPLLPDGYARDPILVAEVLSPSTAKNDRILKAGFYLTVPTLRLFLIVDPHEPRIEIWRRTDADWEHRTLRPGEALAVPELDGSLDVATVYAGIDFDPA